MATMPMLQQHGSMAEMSMAAASSCIIGVGIVYACFQCLVGANRRFLIRQIIENNRHRALACGLIK